jgi:K319-like protein
VIPSPAAMHKRLQSLLLIAGALAVTMVRCSGDPKGPDAVPTASAGADLDVNPAEVVILDGTASTNPNGQTLNFTWTQRSGPPVTLAGATSATPTFKAPDDVTTLEFEVAVSDRIAESVDRVVVFVLEDKNNAFWVSRTGADGNAGTRALPKLTIQNAINTAATSGGDVYVAAGIYPRFTLSSRVSIYGGFDPTTWLRDVAANATVIEGATPAVSGASVNIVPGQTLTLEGLTIRSANAATAGVSSIGIALNNSRNITIRRNAITAGRGADGLDRTQPAKANAGGTGSTSTGRQGAAGGTANGFAGGEGGDGGNTGGIFNTCNSNGADGKVGFGPQGGDPGSGGSGRAGGPGGTGATGATGAAGTPGGGPFGAVASGTYMMSKGADGANGEDGSGGGGGGGGDCASNDPGGGGGGGGAGGDRGLGGLGGGGAGGSFGIVLTNTSTMVAITNNTITTGNGGVGGNGAIGGLGGNGGLPGDGRITVGGGRNGGNGGAGGPGGAGGGGAGGGGGPSVGVARDVSSTTNVTATDDGGNVFTVGTGGNGGPGAGGAPSGATGLKAAFKGP